MHMQTHVFPHTHPLTAWQAKERFEWKLRIKLWNKWPDQSAIINLMSSGNTLFSESMTLWWLIVAGLVTKEWMSGSHEWQDRRCKRQPYSLITLPGPLTVEELRPSLWNLPHLDARKPIIAHPLCWAINRALNSIFVRRKAQRK